MKKFIMLVALIFATVLSVSATTKDDKRKDVVIHPTTIGANQEGNQYPRTPDPSIYAYIEDGVLTVSIDRYLGYVSTTIEDANGAEADSYSEYINGTSTYVMNVSALTPGTYTVYLIFADGREYYGIFTVE